MYITQFNEVISNIFNVWGTGLLHLLNYFVGKYSIYLPIMNVEPLLHDNERTVPLAADRAVCRPQQDRPISYLVICSAVSGKYIEI